MCNNMGFLENLLSGDFGGHFSIFRLYFMLLSPDGIDVLPVVEPLSFAVFTNFILKPLFYNFISGGLVHFQLDAIFLKFS